MTSPDKKTIISWLDDSLMEVVGDVDDAGEFNIIVQQSGWNIHVAKGEDNGPIRVIGKGDLDPESLALILDRDTVRRDFRTRISSVLTSASTIYSYRDDEGESCGFENLRSIQFEHRFYGEHLDEHELNNKIMDIIKALEFLRGTVKDMRDAMDESR